MSRSEKFNPHQEEAASGFPIEPPRPTPVLEAAEDSQKLFPNRASHSGPLVHRTQWSKTQQREDDAAKASEVTNVLARRKVLSEDSKEKISAQVEAVAYAARLSEAGTEHLEPTRKYSQALQRKESERSGNMDPTAVSVSGFDFSSVLFM